MWCWHSLVRLALLDRSDVWGSLRYSCGRRVVPIVSQRRAAVAAWGCLSRESSRVGSIVSRRRAIVVALGCLSVESGHVVLDCLSMESNRRCVGLSLEGEQPYRVDCLSVKSSRLHVGLSLDRGRPRSVDCFSTESGYYCVELSLEESNAVVWCCLLKEEPSELRALSKEYGGTREYTWACECACIVVVIITLTVSVGYTSPP